MHQPHTATRRRAAARAGLGLAAWAMAITAQGQALPEPPVSPTPVTRFEYDAEGNPTKTVVAPGSRNLATQHGYDALGRRTTTTDAKAGITGFSYDLRDELTKVQDPRQLVTKYNVDGMGAVRQVISPDTGTTPGLAYDAAGQLKTRIDSRGVLAYYEYDALNRVKTIVYSRSGDTTRMTRFTYDQTGGVYGYGVGRLTTATTPETSDTFQYDELGRVVFMTQTSGPHRSRGVTYRYNADGTLGMLVYPSGRTAWFTWANGQMTSTGLTAGGVSRTLLDNIVMSPTGPVQSWVWRIGTARPHERVYDTSGRLVRQPLGLLVRDITYDDADRISRYTHYTAASAQPAPAYDQAFSYDDLDRLINVTAATNWSYAYDANGNRTASASGIDARGYSVSATSNRLDALSNPVRSMGYDAAGNTLSDTQPGSSANYTATYNLEGRLAAMAQGSSAGVEFGYDAMGRRTLRSAWAGSPDNPRTVTQYVYDQDHHLLGEYQADGTPVTEYLWLGNTPVAVLKTDATAPGGVQMYAIHTDHLDTPRVILDEQGHVRWRWLGEPFGASPAEEQPTAGLAALQQNLRFPGQQYEPFGGRFYNHFRDYDPTVGRYVQSDPIGLAGGLNTYAYVNGQPTMLTDPRGLAPTKALIWLVRICKKGIEKIRPVSYEEAVQLAKKGEDLQASRDTAKKIANAASEGRGAIKDPVHPDRVTGSTEGRRPHYHANPRNGGHIFYSIAAAATFAGHVDCEDCAMAILAEGLDFFNPLSLPKDLMDLTGVGAPD